MLALAGAGDNVILPVPWYFNHHMWLDMLRIEIRRYRSPGDRLAAIPDAGDARR